MADLFDSVRLLYAVLRRSSLGKSKPWWYLEGIVFGIKIRKNINRVRAVTGITYAPLGHAIPLFTTWPPDLHFAVTLAGATFQIHLTEERGYEDIDGMAHLRMYDFLSPRFYRSWLGGWLTAEL